MSNEDKNLTKEKKRGDVSGFDGIQGAVTQQRIKN